MKLAFTLLLCSSIHFSSSLFAHHIVGGELFYNYIGNNQYEITFEIYRNCNSATGFDEPLSYTVFNPDNTTYKTFNVSYTEVVPLVINQDPCILVPPGVCMERATYIDVITLPLIAGDYTISYQICCWADEISNIESPDISGYSIFTTIPGTASVDTPNNAARFQNNPPLVLCSNRTMTFDHAATDPDGDSLVYEIDDTYEFIPIGLIFTPNPELPPPYNIVKWKPGFSGTVPFGPGSSLTVDQHTGMLEYTPQQWGQYITGVKVNEYRNGVLINSGLRTFAFTVVACDAVTPLTIGPTVSGDDIIENCAATGFNIHRADSTTVMQLQVLIEGEATNGVDFEEIPAFITLQKNQGSYTLPLDTKIDQISEGPESLKISFIYQNPCNNNQDTFAFNLNIKDYQLMTLEQTDKVYTCAEDNQISTLIVQPSFGEPPYNYYWEPPSFPNNDTVTVLPENLKHGLNSFHVTVTDACSKKIAEPKYILNECPLVVPNVLTCNQDNKNDLFIIKNLADYEQVELVIVNRWGNLVYHNKAYQNNWTGLDDNGNQLSDGIYFYTATPKSKKYTYSDQKKSEYTARGFLHLIH